jgi:hypothetical protein
MTTPAKIKEALIDWVGAKHLVFKPGWDTRGRPWSGGLRGVIVHDLVGTDQGAIDWTYAPGEQYPYCNSVTTHDKVIVNSALSCWHSGLGGPWPAVNIPQDQGHLFLWGIEHNIWGRNLNEYSPTMLDLTAKTLCALRDVTGNEWGRRAPFSRVIRHASWTDGGRELGLDYWLRTKGRKVDTLRPLRDWREDARTAWRSRNP